ncbi:Transcription initiation factor TFIID subunit 2 [Porphyridium purpureum]|uniref:Transcription initiation factor TFIID subunit 2 n=1 Tax=Porphyridium purpureum TaxID=35688 RepID=A0A5J4Z8K3_PORPP|nr:Transcription initiation factor TFIID subunit 2 [Porphyridium purpureum]|eukprot:POR7873..scf295_1
MEVDAVGGVERDAGNGRGARLNGGPVAGSAASGARGVAGGADRVAMMAAAFPTDAERRRGFRVLAQHAALHVDLASRSLRGTTRLDVVAVTGNVSCVRLNARRMAIKRVALDGHPCRFEYASALDEPALAKSLLSSSGTGSDGSMEKPLKLRTDELLQETERRLVRAEQSPHAELTVVLPDHRVTENTRQWRDADMEYARVSAAQQAFDVKAPGARALDVQNAQRSFETQFVRAMQRSSVLCIEIEYSCLDAGSALGVTFVGALSTSASTSAPPCDVLAAKAVHAIATDASLAHDAPALYMYAQGSQGRVRGWLPCVDSQDACSRLFFELSVSVPHLPSQMSNTPAQSAVCVAAAQLEDSFVVQDHGSGAGIDESVKTYVYRSSRATLPSELALAAGYFEVVPDPTHFCNITYFCPTHLLARVLDSTLFASVAQATQFLLEFFGLPAPTVPVPTRPGQIGNQGTNPSLQHPLAQCKIVWVDEAEGLSRSRVLASAEGLLIMPISVLAHAAEIDEKLAQTLNLCRALAGVFFGSFVAPFSREDAWLVYGIARFVGGLCARNALGSNWYRLYMRGLGIYLRDNAGTGGAGTAEHRTRGLFAPDPVRKELISSGVALARAEMILYIVERRVGAEVLRKVFCEALHVSSTHHAQVVAYKSGQPSNTTAVSPSGQGHGAGTSQDVPEGLLSIAGLFKMVRSLGGIEIRSIVRQWVYAASVPDFECGYRYEPKKHAVELVIKQKLLMPGRARGALEVLASPGSANVNNPGDHDRSAASAYSGSVVVRVAEPDGTHDHVVELSGVLTFVELQCHSRKSKAKVPTPTSQGAGGSGDGLDGKSDPSVQGATIKAASASSHASHATVRYVRIDPDLEWPGMTVVRQPQPAWLAQLHAERDVVSQFEACVALRDARATKEGCSALLASIMDPRLYYRVREAAAFALSGRALNEDYEYKGAQLLMLYLSSKYMHLPFREANGSALPGSISKAPKGLEEEKDTGTGSKRKSPQGHASLGTGLGLAVQNKNKTIGVPLSAAVAGVPSNAEGSTGDGAGASESGGGTIPPVSAEKKQKNPETDLVRAGINGDMKTEQAPAPLTPVDDTKANAKKVRFAAGAGGGASSKPAAKKGSGTNAADPAKKGTGTGGFHGGAAVSTSAVPKKVSAGGGVVDKSGGTGVGGVSGDKDAAEQKSQREETARRDLRKWIMEVVQDPVKVGAACEQAGRSAAKLNRFGEDYAEYFVKRALVRSLGAVRFSEADRPSAGGSGKHDLYAMYALQVLLQLLVSNNNDESVGDGESVETVTFSDEHYVADLLCSTVSYMELNRAVVPSPIALDAMRFAVHCIRLHECTRCSLRGVLVAAALSCLGRLHRLVPKLSTRCTTALSSIEHLPAPLSSLHQSRFALFCDDADDVGLLYRSMTMNNAGDEARGRAEAAAARTWLTQLLGLHCGSNHALRTRKAAMRALLDVFPTSLGLLRWMLRMGERGAELPYQHSQEALTLPLPLQQHRVRRAVLRSWSTRGVRAASELRRALQSFHPTAQLICRHLLILACTEPDPEIRALSSDLVAILYGSSVPACMLTDAEYDKQRAGLSNRYGVSNAAHERKLADGTKIRIRAPLLGAGVGDQNNANPSASFESVAGGLPAVDGDALTAAASADGDEVPLAAQKRSGKKKRAREGAPGQLSTPVPPSAGLADAAEIGLAVGIPSQSQIVGDSGPPEAKLRRKRKALRKPSHIELPAECNETHQALVLDREDEGLLRKAWAYHPLFVPDVMVHGVHPPASNDAEVASAIPGASSSLKVKISFGKPKPPE